VFFFFFLIRINRKFREVVSFLCSKLCKYVTLGVKSSIIVEIQPVKVLSFIFLKITLTLNKGDQVYFVTQTFTP